MQYHMYGVTFEINGTADSVDEGRVADRCKVLRKPLNQQCKGTPPPPAEYTELYTCTSSIDHLNGSLQLS
jgi:hypothetical protein